MNVTVVLDWKFAVALGFATGVIILTSKMDPEAAERVSTHLADALKGVTVDGITVNL